METQLQRCNANAHNTFLGRNAPNIGYLQLGLIVVVVLTVYGNTLLNGFVYDDSWQILDNSWITNANYIPDIFFHDATRLNLQGGSNYYRPLMNIVYLTTYCLFGGLKPWAFHLVNVLFHLAVSCLVFVVTSALVEAAGSTTPRRFLSIPFLSALIFSVHPVNTEVVAWVACIPELTFTLSCLILLYFHIRSMHDFDRFYLLSLVFFGIAILCKETAVTILPLLFIYDVLWRLDQVSILRCLRKYFPFVLILGLYFAARLHALGGMAPSSRHPELNSFEVVINVIPLFSQYLEKLILPINLNAMYVLHPVHSIVDADFLCSSAIVISFIALGYVLSKRNKLAFFGFMLIAIPLIPVLYIRGLGEHTFSDRYLYLPSIGYSLIIGSISSSQYLAKSKLRSLFNLILSVALVAFSIGAISRNKVWHDEHSLWTDTVQKSPDSFVAHLNLGNALSGKGDFDGALKEFQRAITVNPNYAEAYINLGYVLTGKGDLDGTIRALRHAIMLEPNNHWAHNNLGDALTGKGDLDGAIMELEKAISIKPDYFEAHNNLGIALSNKRDLDGAIKEFQKALAIKPDDATASNNLRISLNERERRVAGPQ
jgi:protein O-mannosyl-transferase